MKILTLNTWQEFGPWRERWEAAFGEIGQIKPDILALQEVFNPERAREIQKRTGLGSLAFREEPSGLCLLSHFPLKAVHGVTFEARSPEEDYLRYGLHAEFSAPKGPLHFFNTHWSWRLEESEIRQKQAEEFLAFIEKHSKGESAVLAGDFNTVAWAPEIQKITAAGFRDLFREANPSDPGITWAYDNPYARGSSHPLPDRRIDYLFAREGAKPVLGALNRATIQFTQPGPGGYYASDHFGVLVQFKE